MKGKEKICFPFPRDPHSFGQGDDVTSEMVETGTPSIIENDLKVTFLTGEGVDKQDYEYEAIVDTLLGETLTENLILEVRGRNVEPTS